MNSATPERRARQRAEKRGRRAEAIAAWFLRAKGFRVLAQRFKTPVGEIDLIVRRRGMIAFVEVKQRKAGDAAVEAVGARSQARIVRAAEAWLALNPNAANNVLRFDVVVVGGGLTLPRHLANAFDAESRR